jgi:hypothetical protein
LKQGSTSRDTDVLLVSPHALSYFCCFSFNLHPTSNTLSPLVPPVQHPATPRHTHFYPSAAAAVGPAVLLVMAESYKLSAAEVMHRGLFTTAQLFKMAPTAALKLVKSAQVGRIFWILTI